MSQTPNNAKELVKLLREYARQRRKAAGSPDMHPATRRILQAEIRQQQGAVAAKTSRPAPGWLAQFWPRVTVACGLLAVLTFFAMLTFPPGGRSKSSVNLAKLDDAKAATDKLTETPAIAPAVAPAPVARSLSLTPAEPATPAIAAVPQTETSRHERSSVALRVEDSLKTVVTREEGDARTESESRPMKSASRAMAKGGSSALLAASSDRQNAGPSAGGMTADQSLNFADSNTVAINAPKPDRTAAFAATAAKGGLNTKNTFESNQAALYANQPRAGASQRFRNIAANEKEAAKLPVLDEFTVEQDGEALTVVDRDGSVYSGFVQTDAPVSGERLDRAYSDATQFAAPSGTRLAGEPRLKARTSQTTGTVSSGNKDESTTQLIPVENQPGPGPQNYFFRVEGTNRSLNERVVFTGNLLQSNLTNTLQSAVQNAANVQVFKRQAVSQNFNQTQQVQVPVQNNFINGRVQVGSDKAGTELNALSVGE